MMEAEGWRSRVRCAVAWGVLVLSGCVMSNRETLVHDPPLARNVGRIVKGITTRGDVVRYFGAPDLEIEGDKVAVSAQSPTNQLRAEAAAKIAKAHRSVPRWAPRTDSAQFDPEQWAALQPYSSVDEEHAALMYWEIASTWRQVMTPPILPLVLVTIVRVKEDVLRNKLLVLVHRQTGVVEAFAYSQEFNAE